MTIEINPFSLVYIFGVIAPNNFIFGLTYDQITLIMKGLTNKQAHSMRQFQNQFIDGKMIKNENILLKNIENNRYSFSKKLRYKEVFFNLWEFFSRNTGESLYFQAINE